MFGRTKTQQMIVLGVILLIVGIVGFLWAAPKMDAMRSGLGQLATALGGQQAAQEAQMYQLAYYGSIIGMIIGAVLLFAGLLILPRQGK